MPDCVSQSSTAILLPEFTGAGGVAPVMTSTGSGICFSSSAGIKLSVTGSKGSAPNTLSCAGTPSI